MFCQIPRHGILPTATFKYNASTSVASKFTQLLRWIADDHFDLALLYHYEPDNTGHLEGPDSPNISKVLTEIELEFGRFVEKLKSRGLYDKVLTASCLPITVFEYELCSVTRYKYQYIFIYCICTV